MIRTTQGLRAYFVSSYDTVVVQISVKHVSKLHFNGFASKLPNSFLSETDITGIDRYDHSA